MNANDTAADIATIVKLRREYDRLPWSPRGSAPTKSFHAFVMERLNCDRLTANRLTDAYAAEVFRRSGKVGA